MILGQLLRDVRMSLIRNGVEEAPLEAELFLMKALGLSRSALYACHERPIARGEIDTLDQDLSRRLTGEPWPYISGHREFYGLDMVVGPGIFVPRPETELLVDLALDLAKSLSPGRTLRIADVGTGSGAIAVALAIHLPQAIIYATDVSALALEAAQLNCERHKIQERVVLLEGDLLDRIAEPVDIVVSNPPYIATEDIPDLPISVLHEPLEALDGGKDGLEVIRSLIPQALKKLRRTGGLVVEISPLQRDQICRMAEKMLPMQSFKVVADLMGRDRALLATMT